MRTRKKIISGILLWREKFVTKDTKYMYQLHRATVSLIVRSEAMK